MNNAKKITLLVVDDSRVSRLLSRQFVLYRHPDWIIEEAASGEEAVEKLSTVSPDLVLLDVNMPGMGGLATVVRLREMSPDLAICLMTANVQDSMRENAKKLGVQFAGKPITQERIDEVISTLENA